MEVGHHDAVEFRHEGGVGDEVGGEEILIQVELPAERRAELEKNHGRAFSPRALP